MFVRANSSPQIETDEYLSSVSQLSSSLRWLFRGEAPREISRQVRRHMERRRELTPAVANEVVRSIEWTGWDGLVTPFRRALSRVSMASGLNALASVGVDPRSQQAGTIAQYAETFAKARAADMVGMRFGPGGKLVANPSAEYAITESTREMIRDAVRIAVQQDWSADRLAEELKRSHAFSSERADLIARTELGEAHNKGVFVAYRTSGTVNGVRWVTMHDGRVEPICKKNEAAGIVQIGSKFPSGHTHPLAHPRCRCWIEPVR